MMWHESSFSDSLKQKKRRIDNFLVVAVERISKLREVNSQTFSNLSRKFIIIYDTAIVFLKKFLTFSLSKKTFKV